MKILIILFVIFWITQQVSALTESQRQAKSIRESEYKNQELKLHNQWKAKPYWCLQKVPWWSQKQFYYNQNQYSLYENVCIDGMTDEEHEKVVKEFEPYVKNPSLFYDKTWTDAKKVLLLIKKWETHETQEGLIDRIVNQYVYGGDTQSSYQKEWVSKKTFKDFITKKMNEIDANKEISKEKAKVQAKKQKEAQEKRTLNKLIQDTSKPYLGFIIKGKQKQFYLDYQRVIAPYFKDLSPQQNITNEFIDTVSSSILNALADFEATQNSIIPWKEDEFKETFTSNISKQYWIIKD